MRRNPRETLLHDLPLGLAARALQGYVALDPQAGRRIPALQGKSLRLHIEGLALAFRLSVNDAGFALSTDDAPADVALRGAPLALLRLLRSDGVQSLFDGSVKLAGDAAVAKQFKRLFDTLDIDWEEQLSRLLGDYPARKLYRLLRTARGWCARTGSALGEDAGDYLREERELLGNRHQSHDLYHGIETLRDDLARLQARLARVESARREA